jgi:hypothetical protein
MRDELIEEQGVENEQIALIDSIIFDKTQGLIHNIHQRFITMHMELIRNFT